MTWCRWCKTVFIDQRCEESILILAYIQNSQQVHSRKLKAVYLSIIANRNHAHAYITKLVFKCHTEFLLLLLYFLVDRLQLLLFGLTSWLNALRMCYSSISPSSPRTLNFHSFVSPLLFTYVCSYTHHTDEKYVVSYEVEVKGFRWEKWFTKEWRLVYCLFSKCLV